MKRNRHILPAVAVLLFAGVNIVLTQPTNNDMIHHRDEENGFAIWYPKTWAEVPTTHAATKLKVVSKKGAGGEDFNVVVVSDASFRKITAERLVEMMVNRPDAVLGRLQTDYPGAEIVESGKTELDSKPAFYVIFDGTFRSFDIEVPMRFLQVSTVYKGRAYYLTSRASPEKFSAKRLIFSVIMGGFRFLER